MKEDTLAGPRTGLSKRTQIKNMRKLARVNRVRERIDQWLEQRERARAASQQDESVLGSDRGPGEDESDSSSDTEVKHGKGRSDEQSSNVLPVSDTESQERQTTDAEGAAICRPGTSSESSRQDGAPGSEPAHVAIMDEGSMNLAQPVMLRGIMEFAVLRWRGWLSASRCLTFCSTDVVYSEYGTYYLLQYGSHWSEKHSSLAPPTLLFAALAF
ncbi:hypothetical protein VTO42DRAFT_7865 [Malbranchea cinnamomea]